MSYAQIWGKGRFLVAKRQRDSPATLWKKERKLHVSSYLSQLCSPEEKRIFLSNIIAHRLMDKFDVNYVRQFRLRLPAIIDRVKNLREEKR